tara:strand:- start:17957 stop:18199 length:243 start_codon:yes stop_codon:yes gene_type:complete
MITIRCKECGTELTSTSKIQCCGCPNMLTIKEENISAVDITKVIMINSIQEPKSVLSSQDLAYQEERRHRKVRKMDFDIK